MRSWVMVLTASLAACGATPVRHEARPAVKPAAKSRVSLGGRKQGAPAVTGVPALDSDVAKKAREAEQAGRLIDALHGYLDLSVQAKETSAQEQFRNKCLDLIETRLDESQLQAVSNDSSFGFLRGHALFRLGQLAADRKDTATARKYFLGVVSFLPGTDLAFQADEMLLQLESFRSVDARTIGVVLPLSGKNAGVGQRALRGIQLGLGLNDPNSNLTLAVMDSEGNPDTARRGVERLVKEDNVIAIIGSLLSKTAPAVAAKANDLGVPTIGLSQRPGLTEAGPVIFRNALTEEMQVRQLVRSAMEDLGLKRFAILVPNDSYGTEAANVFWDEVLARGGTIAAAQVYDSKQTDFRATCERLASTWYVEGREDEFRMILREKAAENLDKKKSSMRQEKSADDVLPPIVDFDAVFIPDNAKMMGTLAAFLSYSGVRNVKLLGTNLWGTPGISKKAGLFGEQLVYVDSAKPNEDPARTPPFFATYKELFGEPPTLIEIQAYESAVILRHLIVNGASSREDLTRRLTDLKSFPGLLGPLDMNDQREVLRPLTTYQTVSGTPMPLEKTR